MRSKAVRLTESAVMLAVAIILSFLRLADLPFGGSVTAASMLPLILVAYRHGVAWGTLTGFVSSLLQLLLGMNALSFATSPLAAAAIITLDYLLAFSSVGLGGVFRRKLPQAAALGCGAALACTVRYACHVVSGCTVWAGLSIPTEAAFWYSLGYNAVYMVPETVVTVAAAVTVGNLLDFSHNDIRGLPRRNKGGHRAVGFCALLLAALVDLTLLFAAAQVKNAAGEPVFDIRGIADANWWVIGGVTLVAAGIAVWCFSRKKQTCFSRKKQK